MGAFTDLLFIYIYIYTFPGGSLTSSRGLRTSEHQE